MTLLLEARNDNADVRWSRREAVANHIVVSLRGAAGGALGARRAARAAARRLARKRARCRQRGGAVARLCDVGASSPRLAPHYARAVVRNALWRPTAGVAPWSWLLTAHEPLLLECIDLVVTQTEPSSLDAVKTLSDLALRWKLAHSHAPLPTAQSNSMRRFASVASEHFAESGARLMQLASE
jgi:hypothetical protein